MIDEPGIDLKALLRNLAKAGASCPICKSVPGTWKVHPDYLDLVNRTGSDRLARVDIEGIIQGHRYLILVTCQCSYAMIFDFTERIQRAAQEVKEKG